MNKLILVVILLITGSSMAQEKKNNFCLSGKIKNQDFEFIYLSYEKPDGQRVKDSALIKNGKFEFRGELYEPTMAFINGAVQSRGMDDPNATSIFLEPTAMTIDLTADDFKNFKLKGSKTQDELYALEKLKAHIRHRKQPIVDAYMSEKDREKAAAIREQFAPFDKKMDEIDLDYINAHPDSYLSAYLMRFKISKLTGVQAKEIFNKWSTRLKSSRFGKEIAAEIKNLQKGSPSATAHVFTTTDINGETLSLADFKGKYILLDFWASWCVPCRKGNPHLLALYSKYKDKGLEIIGISDDDSNHDAWKKAVEKDQIGVWKHVLRGLKRTETGYDKSQDISEPYGIHTLPTKILIDPNGIIIGRYGGGGEDDAAMDKKLAEIFD